MEHSQLISDLTWDRDRETGRTSDWVSAQTRLFSVSYDRTVSGYHSLICAFKILTVGCYSVVFGKWSDPHASVRCALKLSALQSRLACQYPVRLGW